jgi:hypothetical protein
MLKKCIGLIAIFILILSSCNKDNISKENKVKHLLSKSYYFNTKSEVYSYNNLGNIIEIDRFFIHKNDTVVYKMLFEYNSYGLIQKWTQTDTLGNPVMYEQFEYNSAKQLIKRTGYSILTNTNEFGANLTAIFSYYENKIKVQIGNNFVEFEFDNNKKNIITRRYYRDGILNNIITFSYDNKLNPMYDLKLPLPLNEYDIFSDVSYFSKNNVIIENSVDITYNNGVIDSIPSYKYNIKYNYDSLEYPVYLDNGYVNYKFEYKDLK